MVAWWPGNGNADDIQGGHTGETVNGVTFGVGMVGRAFSFDGIDDQVEVPAAPEWHLGSSDFTIDFWVNVTNTRPIRARCRDQR